MEVIAFLFGLGVIAVVFIAPIVALVFASRAKKQSKGVLEALLTAELRAERAEHQLRKLEERLVRVETAVASQSPTAGSAAPAARGPAQHSFVDAAAAQPGANAQSARENSGGHGLTAQGDSVPSSQQELPPSAIVGEAKAEPETVSTAVESLEVAVAFAKAAPTEEQQATLSAVDTANADATDGLLGDTHESAAGRSEAPSGSSFQTATPAAAESQVDADENPFNRPPARLNWESLVGVRLFAWLGGGALFLGAALFLHYSIQQNLISPAIRVALGMVTGALLLAGGDRVRLKAMMAGQAIMGAGVGTLYAALYAARTLYHLIPTSGAFAGMILLTATAGALAIRRNAYLLAVLGLIGGMATPFLLSTGEDHPWPFLAYVLLLDVGIAYVSRKREWPTLALFGFCASLLVFMAWCTRYLYAGRAPYALAAVGIVAALFASLVRFKPTAPGGSNSTLRALAQFAVATPLATALILVMNRPGDVSPVFLTGYVVIITFGAAMVAHHLGARHLPIAVAVFGIVTQLVRTDSHYFPEHAISTLASFSMLPVAHAVIFWWKRRTEFSKIHLWALGIVLASPLAIASMAAGCQQENARYLAIAIYTAAHGAGLLFLAVRFTEARFFVLAQVVVWVVELAIQFAGGSSVHNAWSVWVLAAGVVFWSLPLLASPLKREVLALGTAAFSLPSQFAILYLFSRLHGHFQGHGAFAFWQAGPLGLLSVLGGLAMLVGIRRLRSLQIEREADRTALLALHGALCLAFLTAALPILLEKQWLTVAFGFEVAALAWLRRRVAHDGLVAAIAALAATALVRLLLNSSVWHYEARSGVPILNYYLYTFALVALSFLLAAKLLAANRAAAQYKLGMLLNWAAVVVCFVLVNIEVADYFSTGKMVVFRMSGGGLAEDMAYSLAWGCFALALMVLGIIRRIGGLRLGALLFLCLTVGKVFLHDLWQLGALYRVGSVVGLAVALLAVSYLVQRFILPGEKL